MRSRCLIALAVAGVVGCVDEPWTFRPRDGSVAPDRPAPTVDGGGDAPSVPVDGDEPTDAGALEDAQAVDLGEGQDVVTELDAGVVDATTPIDTGPPIDATLPPPGRRLLAQGSASLSGASVSVGSLRLSETAFETGRGACVGALCLTGGMVP